MNYQINETETRVTIAKSMLKLTQMLDENDSRIKSLLDEKTPLSMIKALMIVNTLREKMEKELTLVKMMAVSINDEELIKQIENAQNHFNNVFKF